MDKIVIFCFILVIYLLRFFLRKVEGKTVGFLLVSFFLFCIPFDITKGVSEVNNKVYAGSLGPTLYITVAIFMLVLLIPFANWNRIGFKFKLSDWVCVVLLLSVISLFNPNNISPYGTILFVVFFVTHILLFKMLQSMLTYEDIIKGLFDGFVALCIIQLVLAICFPLLGITEVTTMFHEIAEETATRHSSDRVGAVGTFKHPSNLAFFVVVASSFFLGASLSGYKKRMSLLLIIANIITLILTYSRTSYLSFIFVIFIVLYLYRNADKNIFSLSRIFKFILPLGLALSWLIYFSPFSDTFLQSDSDVQFDNRWNHWLIAFQIFEQSPLIGVGLNSHLAFISKNFSIAQVFTVDDFFTEQPIHNIHLIMLAETGIIGLFLWFVFIFRNIFAAKRNLSVGAHSILPITFIGILVAYLVYGMAGWTPFSRGIMPLFLLITFFSISFNRNSIK